MLDSALRGPHDALGVINTPQDAESLRGMDFAKLFQNLEGAVNLTPTTPWLIVETTLLIGLALMVACMTQSVMVVWAVVGSTVTFVIAFLLPALYYRYVFPFCLYLTLWIPKHYIVIIGISVYYDDVLCPQ